MRWCQKQQTAVLLCYRAVGAVYVLRPRAWMLPWLWGGGGVPGHLCQRLCLFLFLWLVMQHGEPTCTCTYAVGRVFEGWRCEGAVLRCEELVACCLLALCLPGSGTAVYFGC